MRSIKILPRPKSKFLTGVDTYWEDFRRVVLPEINENFRLMKENEHTQCILAFFQVQPPLYSVPDSQVIVYQVLHNDLASGYYQRWAKDFKNHKFITHYTEFWFKMVSDGFRVIFIPMTIDTKVVPAQKEERNGKIIFFTNIYKEKEDTLKKIGEAGIECDVMSLGKLNGEGDYTHDEALEIVSNYEIGIGVGRSAIEMLTMGLKVVIAGKQYGGPIKNSHDITEHWRTNFNSTYHNGAENILDDFKDLFRIPADRINIFDMRSYLHLYKKFFDITN